MNQKSIDKLKDEMSATYRKFGDEIALRNSNGKSYTGNQIANEIENETDLGIDLMDMMIQLAIDLVKRDKINDTKDK